MRGSAQIFLFLIWLFPGGVYAQSQVDLITCTSNLQAVYTGPLTERRLTGAVFRFSAQGEETLAACQRYAAATVEGKAQATLWYAYALLAAGQDAAALDMLLALEGPVRPTRPWADPLRRALHLRQELMGQIGEPPHPLFADKAAPETRLRLVKAGLLSVKPTLHQLEEEGAYTTLLKIYSGSQALEIDGKPLEPDLGKLRALADAAVSKALLEDDPLAAMRALKNASGYFQREQEDHDLKANPGQARWRLEQALGLGLIGWHQIERDEVYREDLLRETLPLVSILLETSDTADVLYSIGEAIAADWAGLRTGQGLDAAAAFQAAAQAGSAKAKARLALAALNQRQREAASVLADLNALRQQDSCVYTALASAYRQGLITGRPDPAKAREIYTAGQRIGDAGSFLGGGEMWRFAIGSELDFAIAKDLFLRALNQFNLARCNRAVPAKAHLSLAWLAHTGQGGAVDLVAAQSHFRQATHWGSFLSAEALAELHFFGLGVPQDPILAYDYATKAYHWNKQNHPILIAFSLFANSGADLLGLETLGLPDPETSLAVLSEGAQAGSFSSALLLGLKVSIQPELSASLPRRPKSNDILATLDSHFGAFERGYQRRSGPAQMLEWDTMNTHLAGQINLAFTAARYDTVAAIQPDPARALAFYRALPPEHPVAIKMLNLDRFPYLSERGQRRVGNGPITLTDVVNQGLDTQLSPLPLAILLSP